MALYLNNEKVKINIGGKVYILNIAPINIERIKLLSLDGYILTDSNGVYLIAKENK